VRRDKEMQANAGMIRLPVAVVNHGNTVKHTKYCSWQASWPRAVIARRHPQQPVTRAQISARQASLRPAPSRGMLLLQTQAVPPRRHPLRKNRPKLPSRRHSRCHRLMDAISVHTA
jgi:hypothetical protein